jgi:hypothetical protein
MEKEDKLTPSELSRFVALYQSLMTIITFFAGFVFVTVPLIVFSADSLSSLYGRLILYSLLASLFLFMTIIDVYHSAVLRAYQETDPKVIQIIKKYVPRMTDRLIATAAFLALASISFMLLLKGQEWAIEALIWFLIAVVRTILGHFLVHRYVKESSSKL